MTPHADDLLKPLSSEATATQDPREGENFAQMNLEIDKLSSLTAQSLPDWSRVEQLACGYLQSEAKDYLVASWLSEAWTQQYDLNGICAGLTLLAGLTEQYWDTALPPVKRLRGRRNAIAWWIDRVTQRLERPSDTLITSQLSESLVKAAKDLDELLASKDPDADSLRPLISHLQRIPVQEEAPAAAPAAPEQTDTPDATASDAPAAETTSPPKTAEQPPSAPAVAAASPPKAVAQPVEDTEIEIHSLDDLGPLLRPVQNQITLVGSALLQFDPTNPLSIQFTRFAARAHISELPMATGGQTAIAPPAVAIVDAFEKISQSKNAEGLIAFCESRVREYPFWLDLDYQSAKGFSALAAGGARMRETLIDLMLGFLKQLPGIEHLTFSDGTPFAQPETLAWIERCRQERTGQSPVDAFEQAKQEAQGLLADGKATQAVAVLQAFMNGTRSHRDQFRARLAIVEIGLDQTVPPHPLALVQQLTDDCETRLLDQWEPELATAAWQLSARVAQQGLSGAEQFMSPTTAACYQAALDKAIAHLTTLDYALAMRYATTTK